MPLPGDFDPTRSATGSRDSIGQIGPYHLLEKIGEGGMGEVWVAEQHEPIRRTVAVKVIKIGMDTRQVVARFDAERQALAVMDHPAIAKVLDAGATEQGRPYFVMEYVKGEPITAYCDRVRLATTDRLALFVRVCEGVQHAHQKGIIHRDLKPSNVLVTIQDGLPVPKIIDFGIAKATGHQLAEQTIYTELGVLVGTPEYMSPEQAEMGGLDIDTRTDIYSLGTLLYELLTGSLPFEPKALREKALDEIRRTIRETDPPRPSTRVTQLGPASTEAARRRLTEPARLASQLRGDLDWITMKALEKDRTRRYETAMGLANDVRRHLANEPVSAGPPGTAYRAKKFARRHRAGVLASAVVVLALVAGIAGTTVGLLRAVRAERRASEEAQAARQMSDFLLGLFRVADPNEARGNTVTAREILDRGTDKISRELAGQPKVQRRLMHAMGKVYLSLGLYKTSVSLQEKALQVARTITDEPLLRGGQELELAWLYKFQGRVDEAIPLCRDGLAIYTKELGPTHLDTGMAIRLLGILLRDKGDYAEAQRLLEQSVSIIEKAAGPNDKEVAGSLYHLGWLLKLTGRSAQAQAPYERALRIWESSVGTDNTMYAWCLNDLAVVHEDLRDFETARRLHERALAIRTRLVGPDHPDVSATLNNLGSLLWRMQDYREAASVSERALAIRERAMGPDSPDTADTLGNLGLIYADLGDSARAGEYYRRALLIYEKAYGRDHPSVASPLVGLGGLREKAGDFRGADAAYTRAMSVYDRSPGVDPTTVAEALSGAARVSVSLGDLARATALYERLLTMNDRLATQDPRFAAKVLDAHAALLRRTGRVAAATRLEAQAAALRNKR